MEWYRDGRWASRLFDTEDQLHVIVEILPPNTARAWYCGWEDVVHFGGCENQVDIYRIMRCEGGKVASKYS